MTIATRFLLLLLCLVPPAAHGGAPPKPRPLAGVGLLVLRPLSPARRADVATLVLYRAPGVGRVGEFATSSLPSLGQIFDARDDGVRLAVVGKKGAWLRIEYDDAGHEGWLLLARSWSYTPWEALLPGLRVRLLPGLRREYAVLRKGSAADAGVLGTVGPQQRLRVSRVEGDWALVAVDGGSGWLRWRDEDGRFLVAPGEGNPAQNR